MTEKKKHKQVDEPIDPASTVQKALGVRSAAEITFTPIKRKDGAMVQKQKQVLESSAFLADDEFGSLNENLRSTIIAPPFAPRFLVHLCLNNNALMQSVAAMELNVDGTGHILKEPDRKDGEEEDTQAISKSNSFFKEPWPGESFVSLRRQKRRDEEMTGNAYFEVLRTIDGKIAFARVLDATTIRMVRLDEPVERDFEVERDGKMVKLTMAVRERRFAQAVPRTFSTVAGTDPTRGKQINLIYFKEFGTSRDLDKTTGKWAEKGASINASLKATELIHFTVNKTAGTPYGIPRWISQTPSILGSRKAEELNLDFFNAGGLPPAMIIISGGQLTEPVRQQVQNYLSGKGASKHRAAIIEAHSTSGSMEGGGSSVSVRVERFGSEKQKDSLFENYDERCEKRVRSSFRLPPLFVGRTEDFNFASANVSYLVAEAQVFGPERKEFDDRMNATLLKEINPDLEFKSNPITLKDVTNQIKAITLASKGTSAIDNDNLVKMLNLVTSLELEAQAPEEVSTRRRRLPVAPAPGVGSAAGGVQPAAGQPRPAPNQDGGEPPVKRTTKAWSEKLIDVARTWAAIHTGELELSDRDKAVLVTAMESLDESSRRLFDQVVAIQMLAGYGFDPEGAEELTAKACELLSGSQT